MKAGHFEKKKWILRLSVEQIVLSTEFNNVIRDITLKLRQTKNNNNVTTDEKLFTQILLHVLGHNIRKDIRTVNYYPENLREPFVRDMVKNELCSQVFGQLALAIRKGAVLATHQDEAQKCFDLMKQIIQTNLNTFLTCHIENEMGTTKERISEEDLGWFVVASLYRRFTSMVAPCNSLLGGGVGLLGVRRGRDKNHLHHNYDVTHRINVTTPYFDSQRRSADKASIPRVTASGKKAEAGSTLTHFASREDVGGKENIVESSIEDEATDISSNFFSSDMEKLCEKLQGHSLPESLRGHIWMFCCLHRSWGDPPEGPSLSSELVRLGALRGMPIDSFESNVFSKYASANASLTRQAIAELTRTIVEKVYLEGFPLRCAVLAGGGSRPCTPASQPTSASATGMGGRTRAENKSFANKAYAHFLSRHLLPPSSSIKALPDDLQSMASEMSLDSQASNAWLQHESLPGSAAAAPLPPHSADSALLRRTEVLLRAEYVLTGEVTKRGAAVALMILIVFPDASPISEKILRLFRHIHNDCLPSEQMHHSFSIVSTAKNTFSILSKEEPVLYAHIQKVFDKSSYAELLVDTENNQDATDNDITKIEVNSDKRVPLRPPLPGATAPSASYVLLRPWLETGFVGYLSEFTVSFIWDQCFMFGGRSKDWKKVLPIVCFTIIKILKNDILHENTVENIQRILTKESKRIRTKIFSMLLRGRLDGLPRNKWFASPFQDTSLTLDKIRAVVMLQKLGRGRVDRKRVRDMLQSQQDERDRQAAKERAAITDWKAEIERQAAEWRAEFLRKKEEEEMERVVAVQQTIEHLIEKTMLAHGELPEGETPKKQKSAYQIEWERLQSDDYTTTGDNTDAEADDIVVPTTNRSVIDELNGITSEEKEELKNQNSEESGEVANSIVETVFTSAFEIIDQKQQVRLDKKIEAEHYERRRETNAVINMMIDRLVEAMDKIDEGNKMEASTKIEEVKETESLPATDVINSLMSDMITQLESISHTDANIFSSENDTTTIDTPETKMDEIIESKPEVETSTPEVKGPVNNEEDEEVAEDEEERQSNLFRATLPKVEVDALGGFFEDQRAAIRTLQTEKTRLKNITKKYKKKFEKKYGHTPGWHERTKDITATYEDYQEISFNLKTVETNLRREEDELLRKWQQKKKRKESQSSGAMDRT